MYSSTVKIFKLMNIDGYDYTFFANFLVKLSQQDNNDGKIQI